MKTQLIALESHDDLTSVKDKMSWAKTQRILLIWPKGEAIALRPLDLKVLQRHARSLGATLGLVSRDPRVRWEAAARNLPVFDSPRMAQVDEWSKSSPPAFHPPRNRKALRVLRDAAHPGKPRWQTSQIIRFGAFTLGVLSVLIITLLFLPRAEINLSPESRTQSLTIPVTADPALTSVVITGSVPANEGIYEVAGTLQIPSTGVMTIPKIEAKGVARFRNLTQSRIQIPLGTIVHTLGASPIKFVTTQQADISAGVGKIVDVPIEAVGAGAGGNLGVDLIQVIEGPLGVSLTVTNPAPTSGGTEHTVAAPSIDDGRRLSDLLMENLRTRMQLEMLANLPIGSVILPDTVEDVVVLEETYDPQPGKTGNTLTLTMRVKFTARYVSGGDLSELALLALSASLEKGFTPTSESPTFYPKGIPVTDDTGRSNFDLHIERRIQRAVDARLVVLSVQGKTIESALTSLEESIKLSSPPVVNITPAWWPWLPIIPFRINVVIQ